MLTEQLTREIVEGMRRILGEKLYAVILYGSAARGDSGPESDIDIALLLRSPPDRTEWDGYISFFADLGMENDAVFSPMDIDLKSYNRWGSVLPYYRSIREEGVVLWKAA